METESTHNEPDSLFRTIEISSTHKEQGGTVNQLMVEFWSRLLVCNVIIIIVNRIIIIIHVQNFETCFTTGKDSKQERQIDNAKYLQRRDMMHAVYSWYYIHYIKEV